MAWLRTRTSSCLVVALAAVAVLLAGLVSLPGVARPRTPAPVRAAAPAAGAVPATIQHWTPYDRPATYGVTTVHDVPITMSDGVVLRADVARPAAAGRFPVLVTQTPYNKLASTPDTYFTARGYAVVDLDVRGTGSSDGNWSAMGPREQLDGKEVVAWAARQPWSDGKVGLYGESYMAINQLLTAAQQPPALKAIFPVVPMGDAYRDIFFSGGQVDTSFVPLWAGLVLGTSVVPSPDTVKADPLHALLNAVGSHLVGSTTGTIGPALVNAALGGELAYDGPFWDSRSPLDAISRVKVPAFVVGGDHDLFQRSEPLLYEALRRQGVPTKLLLGPWYHTTVGQGLPNAAVPESLDQLELRWFDHWLKGIDTHLDEIPDVTQYQLGSGAWQTQTSWPDPALAPQRFYLQHGAGLTTTAPTAAQPGDTTLQQPLSGLCSGSTAQWTAGIGAFFPCVGNTRYNLPPGLSWKTAPLQRPLAFDGPISADLWVTTTAQDASVTVRVVDVAPNGTETDLTDGWLAASFRATDSAKSRIVDGVDLQPWHPYTKASVLPVMPGKPMLLRVQVFPTNVVIPAGHRLMVRVETSDVPHALPTLPMALHELGGVLTVLHDPSHPSSLNLPVVPAGH